MCVLFFEARSCYSKGATGQSPKIILQEVTKMALTNIAGWNEDENKQTSAACGTACGAADKSEDKPAACGSACGAADKPTACGTACGAADKPEEKPAACGTACGASDK